MKTKHTQGEWEVRISGFKDYVAVDTKGIANTENRSIIYKPFNPQSNNFNEEYYEEWKANAKLIAAAPDLLEALNEARKKIIGESFETRQTILLRIDEAIKKATE